MINVNLTNGSDTVTVLLPRNDRDLYDDLASFFPGGPARPVCQITEVRLPKFIACLEGQEVDLDELNYLAKRMDSLGYKEIIPFAESAKLEGFTSVKDLINLTFNMDRYAVISAEPDAQAVAEGYLMHIQGYVSPRETDAEQLNALGQELLSSGQCVPTEHGVLLRDQEIPFREVYQGKTFPLHVYKPCILIAELSYQGQQEYVYLPTDTLSIDKALSRLGSPSLSDCGLLVDDFGKGNDAFHDLCNNILGTEGLQPMNALLEKVSQSVRPEQMEHFYEALAATGVSDTQGASRIAENLDKFYFAKDVKNEADLAKWWLENISPYQVSEEVSAFFDYQGYGEQLTSYWEVFYQSSGNCVFLADDSSLKNILGQQDTEEPQLDGMAGI